MRYASIESTSLGAAYLAGLAVGYYESTADIIYNWKLGRQFEPSMDASEREKLLKGWHVAVKCARIYGEEMNEWD